jgi:hypothetical protein
VAQEQVPLTALLSWAWTAFAIEADNEVEAAGAERVGRLFRISMATWLNGLRLIGPDGITPGDLEARAGAACNIGGLERWGWISVGDPVAGRRDGYGSRRGVRADTVLRPTRAGSYARRLWPRGVAGTEQRWRDRLGDAAVDGLRAALAPLGGPLPWSPPEVNPSDGFFSTVTEVRAASADPADDGGLAVLLGQALTTLTLAHEQGAAVSLPVGANVLRVTGDQVVRLADLPRLAGVSKEAIAMAAGWLQRSGLSEPRPQRSMALTAAGHDALADYRARAAGPRAPELRARLAAIAPELPAGLAPPAGGWRGERPYLAQTTRVRADPAALPWQPMVLHRGGWPDGS